MPCTYRTVSLRESARSRRDVLVLYKRGMATDGGVGAQSVSLLGVLRIVSRGCGTRAEVEPDHGRAESNYGGENRFGPVQQVLVVWLSEQSDEGQHQYKGQKSEHDEGEGLHDPCPRRRGFGYLLGLPSNAFLRRGSMMGQIQIRHSACWCGIAHLTTTFCSPR